MTYEDFAKKEHQKRVAHFVRYVDSIKHKPTIQECIDIFGFCERDARPIYDDAVMIVVVRRGTVTGRFTGTGASPNIKEIDRRIK